MPSLCQSDARKNTGSTREKRHPLNRFCAMICAKSPILIKTTGIDRLQSEKSRGASSDMEDALRLVRFKKSSNIRKNCFETTKEKPPTARSTSTVCGAPNRIRTCGLLIRSQTLYPAELWVRVHQEQEILYSRERGLSTPFFDFFFASPASGPCAQAAAVSARRLR